MIEWSFNEVVRNADWVLWTNKGPKNLNFNVIYVLKMQVYPIIHPLLL